MSKIFQALEKHDMREACFIHFIWKQYFAVPEKVDLSKADVGVLHSVGDLEQEVRA